jgi:Uma2 family endonuclease
MEYRRDYAEAEQYLREAVQMQPKRPAFLTDLARVIIVAGRRDRFAEARALLRKAQESASPEFGWPSKLLVELELSTKLAMHVEPRVLGEVYSAGTRFQRSLEPGSVFSPDVSFVRRERLGEITKTEGVFAGAPDLAVKVVPPDQSAREPKEEVAEWLTAGCRMVVVVNPTRRTATVYRSDSDTLNLTETDVLDGGDVVPGWQLPLGELFD